MTTAADSSSAAATPAGAEPQAPARSVAGLPRRAALLIVAGSTPLVLLAVILTWRHPAYRFFPLAWLAGLWLIRRGWRQMSADLVPGTHVGTALLLGAAWALAAVSTLLWSSWGGAMAALLAVIGLVWWAGGWPATRAFLPGMCVVALAVPPPLGLDFRLLGWLGAKSISAASRLLHDFSVVHYVGAETMELPRLELPLASMSALVNVLPAMAAFAVFYAAWRRNSLWRGFLMAPPAAALALAAATLTLALAVRASAAWRVDLLAGVRGGLLLLAVVAVTAALVASLDEFMEFLLSPILSAEAGLVTGADRGGPCPSLVLLAPPTGLARWGAWAFLALGLLQVPLVGLSLRHEFGAPPPLTSRLPASARFELAPPSPRWLAAAKAPLFLPLVQTNAATRGVWYFTDGNVAAAVVLDYPVRADADALATYSRAGWRDVGPRLHPAEAEAAGPWTDGLMQKDRSQVSGYWIGRLDETGRWLGQPRQDFSLLTPFRAPANPPAAMQVFVLAVAKASLTESDREAVEALFQAARRELGQQFLTQLTPP